MILVTLPSKPFPYSNKGYPRRPLALQLYAEEINAVYEEVVAVQLTSEDTRSGHEANGEYEIIDCVECMFECV